MCILAGLAITLFYVVTRDARAATPLAALMGWNKVCIAAMALPVVLLETPAPADALFVPDWPRWGWMLGLVVLTTVAGHGLMNLAARGVTLFALNIVIVLEPAIAIAMGAVLFGARVTALQLAGGVLLGAAVVVGLGGKRST
jgi:drug/metabolite transporter (DMT)-like permease